MGIVHAKIVTAGPPVEGDKLARWITSWRVAQALIPLGSPTQWVPRSFAFFAKGGSRKCRRQVGLIRVRNKIK